MFWKRLWGKTAADLIRLYMLAVYRPRKTGFRPPEGPVIYVSNHINHLDGMLLLAALRKLRPCALVARDWFEKPVYRPICEAANCLAVSRQGLDTLWLHAAREKMAAGSSVIIFPEGHTNHGGGMDAFKPGFAMLAAMTGAPVVPVWHDRCRAFRRTELRFGGEETVGRAMTAAALGAEGERFRGLVGALGEEKGR